MGKDDRLIQPRSNAQLMCFSCRGLLTLSLNWTSSWIFDIQMQALCFTYLSEEAISRGSRSSTADPLYHLCTPRSFTSRQTQSLQVLQSLYSCVVQWYTKTNHPPRGRSPSHRCGWLVFYSSQPRSTKYIELNDLRAYTRSEVQPRIVSQVCSSTIFQPAILRGARIPFSSRRDEPSMSFDSRIREPRISTNVNFMDGGSH